MTRPGPKPGRRYDVTGIIPPGNDRAIAERFGINRNAVANWRAYGVTWPTADRIAIGLGLHPCEVWPDFHEETAA